ncbi:MAG: sulfatase [Candidatus Woesearchaeota archaeon]
MEKPNILLITTDTQRCDTLKCMGNEKAISPNIDKLADEGVLFEKAHTSSPVCGPTRASLITGVHTPIHGCIENGIKRRDDMPVFTDLLKEQGYTNIMVGKTHFEPIPDSIDILKKDLSDPERIQETIKQIKKVSQNKDPFFAFCSINGPHTPLLVPDKWADLYKMEELPEINYRPGELEKHSPAMKRLLGLDGSIEEFKSLSYAKDFPLGHLYEAQGLKINDFDLEEINKFRRKYYSFAAYCDHLIGKLLDFINQSGLRKNTLIIFSSDHGFQNFDHGFNDKHTFFDESWRVPLIISMPGTIPCGEKRDFAIWNDITATILGAANTEGKTVQGFDLFTPLVHNEKNPRNCAVGTLFKSAALATNNWKLIYYFEEKEGRLFNTKEDPQEQNDLYYNNNFEDIRNRLIKALLTWRSDICDLHYLIENSSMGGPVASRSNYLIRKMKGIDSEKRLNEMVDEIDNEF